MAYEQKPNSGSLFKNDKKEKDTHPDYTGNALIGGEEYWISAWLKETKGGKKKFFSFSFKPKEDNQRKPAEKTRQEETRKAQADLEEDDVPF